MTLVEQKVIPGAMGFPSPARMVKHSGLNINADGDDATQLAIMNAHLQNFNKGSAHDGYVMFDRCALDGFVYTRWLFRDHKISDDTYDKCEAIYNQLISKYDVVFRMIPFGAIIPDGIRPEDEEFRMEIESMYTDTIRDIKTTKVYNVEGSVQERLELCANIINNKI